MSDTQQSIVTNSSQSLSYSTLGIDSSFHLSTGSEAADFALGGNESDIYDDTILVHSSQSQEQGNAPFGSGNYEELENGIVVVHSTQSQEGVSSAGSGSMCPKCIQCSICLESPAGRRPQTTLCGHIFCFDCLTMALARKKECPVCKAKISTKDYHNIYV